MTTMDGGSSASSSSALGNSTSELSQLLSSLGVTTSTGQASASSLGPDPLVVSRGRLTKLRADVEYGSEILKQLAGVTPTVQGGNGAIAIRSIPPLTSKSDNSEVGPPFILLAAGGAAEIEQACQRDGTSYVVFETKEKALLHARDVVMALIKHFEDLRSSLVKEAQARIQETMKQAKASSGPMDVDEPEGADPTLVDEDGRPLNEEGLPFFDPTEPLADSIGGGDSQARQGSTVAAFQPKVKLTGEARKKWIDEVFSRMEGHRGDDEANDEQQQDAMSGVLPDDQTEADEDAAIAQEEKKAFIESIEAARRQQQQGPMEASSSTQPTPAASGSRPSTPPKPLKSVLKPTPPPLKRFGSAGIKRGFLNMNPSSPAAVQSSDPIQAASLEMQRASSVGGPVSNKAALAAEADQERMSRSEELQPKRKKSVRIISPERSRGDAKASTTPSSSASGKAKEGVHPDDIGVEDEAARIVRLLGPTVVEGTPAGNEALRKLKKEDEALATAQAQEAVRQREAAAKKKRTQEDPNRKPAIGMSVMERSKGAKTLSASDSASSDLQQQAQKAKVSAFKRGFLSMPPTVVPNRPLRAAGPSSTESQKAPPPTQTLGMSALERSFINDGPLEEERATQGLTPAVPHARPSKAYAEKLERKKLQEAGEASKDEPVSSTSSPAIVGTGAADSKVRFQVTPSKPSSTSEAADEGAHNEINPTADDGDDEDTKEIDEHDEEMFARAAYASGNHSDDEDQEKDTSLNGFADDDSDWELDSYDYDSDDLADLEPTFDGLVSDLETAELAREYALMKAKQAAFRETMTEERRRELEKIIAGEVTRDEREDHRGRGGKNDLWKEEEIDGRDLEAIAGPSSEGGGSGNKMSRFRASRIVQALGMGADVAAKPRAPAGLKDGTEEDRRADEAGHELAHMLEHAFNVGPNPSSLGGTSTEGDAAQGGQDATIAPVMVLPSLTPLRYPSKSAAVKHRGHLTEDDSLPREGVDLDGETDEDEAEDNLMSVMRARLEEKEERERMRWEEEQEREQRRATDGGSEAEAAGSGTAAPSNTKQQRARGDRDETGRTSGVAMVAPPSLSGRKQQQQQQQSFQPAPATMSSSAPLPSTTQSSSPPPPSTGKVSRFKAARMKATE